MSNISNFALVLEFKLDRRPIIESTLRFQEVIGDGAESLPVTSETESSLGFLDSQKAFWSPIHQHVEYQRYST